MASAQIIGPAALEISFDRLEVAAAVIRILARQMAELVCRTNVVVAAVGESIGARVIGLTIVVVILIAELLRSLGNGSARPPSAYCPGKTAYHGADRTRGRADSGACDYARYTSNRLAHFISSAGVVAMAENSAVVRVPWIAIHLASWNQFRRVVLLTAKGQF